MKQKPLVNKLIAFSPVLAEQLRKFAYVNRTNQSQVVRDAVEFYFKTPKGDK